MLEFCEVTVSYDKKPVLEQIRFPLKEHRLTVLLGRNGSGKSTLVGALNQRIPYTGQILLHGKDVSAMRPKDRAKQIAVLPQVLSAPHILVEELVAFGRSPYLDLTGRLAAEDRELVDKAITDAEVEDLRGRFVDTLSGGERQRVYLAMILAQNTPIVILDEPTAHMDQQHEAAFLRCLQKLKPEKTFLVILHDLTLAAQFADELAVIDRHKLVYAGEREQCVEQGILERTFSVRKYVLEQDGQRLTFFSAV